MTALATGALSFVAGVLVALIAIPRPKPEVRTEYRDVVKTVEAKATAEVQTRIVETPGPVRIQRVIVRTRGPEESCGEHIEETETRDVGGRRVIEEATRQATERREQTHERVVRDSTAGHPRWHISIQGRPGLPSVLGDGARWWFGGTVERRIAGPVSFGVVGSWHSGRGIEGGLSLGVQW